MCGLFGAKRLTSLAGIFFQPSLGACLQATVLLASYMYADVLWAGHTIFLPHEQRTQGSKIAWQAQRTSAFEANSTVDSDTFT